MSKQLLGVVNSFDPSPKLWQNAVLAVEWKDDRFICTGQREGNEKYMKAMDGWVFTMNHFAREQGVDHPTYAVYDARTMELTPLTKEEFDKIGEL